MAQNTRERTAKINCLLIDMLQKKSIKYCVLNEVANDKDNFNGCD